MCTVLSKTSDQKPVHLTEWCSENVLTVSDQHQGALGLGLSVVDLDGVGAFVGSGELFHRHLDDSCAHVMTDLITLTMKKTQRQKSTSVEHVFSVTSETLELKKNQTWIKHLSSSDFLVVHDEPVVDRGGQFDGLHPETHVTFLQDFVVQAVFQRNDCEQTEKQFLDICTKKRTAVFSLCH